MGKAPKHTVLSPEEVEALLARVEAGTLEATDKKILLGIVRFYVWLQDSLQEATITIARLCKLFGFKKTEKSRYVASKDDSDDKDDDPDSDPDPDPGSGLSDGTFTQTGLSTLFRRVRRLLKGNKDATKNKEKKKGHGRNGHEAYTNATVVDHPHESLHSGDDCPLDCGGHLYNFKPRAVVCLEGHMLCSAEKHVFKRLRCGSCGELFTASSSTLPEKYASSLKAVLAIAKYYSGLPFYRMQALQQMIGVPLPATTQWFLVDGLARVVDPVYGAMETLAAQGELIAHDDTTVRILSLMRENKEKEARGEKGRTGMYTTGIVSRIKEGLHERFIYLFISGRFHSGENMTALLAKRLPGLAMVVRMADALSANMKVAFESMVSKCLVHGRRKFYEIYHYFPGECRVIIDGLALVYAYDAITKQQNMNPEERLRYHQKYSLPVMTQLHRWLKEKWSGKEVEPNSALGKAIKYMLNHWEGLTLFLKVPGAILDNNITERALKIPIRCRKTAMFYKNERGAYVAGALTSLIHTCVMAGENPFEYLIALQKHAPLLADNPEAWFPWNYRQTVADLLGLPAPPLQQVA